MAAVSLVNLVSSFNVVSVDSPAPVSIINSHLWPSIEAVIMGGTIGLIV